MLPPAVGPHRRDVLEEVAVRFGIRIGELPSVEQPADLLPERDIGQGARLLVPKLGVRGQLGQHSDEAVGNGLTAGICGGLQDLEHRVHGHALCGVEHKRPALRVVAAHLDEPAQCLWLECRNQPSGAPAQNAGIAGRGFIQLARDLQEVADDHLVVGLDALVFVNGPRDNGRLGRRRRGRNCGGVASHRRCRQAHPQLASSRADVAAGTAAGGQRSIGNQCETVEGERMEPHVGPFRQLVGWQQADWALPIAVNGKCAQGAADFGGLDPAREAHGAEMMPMQALGETPKHGLPGIGGDALNDELVPGHTQCYPLAVLQQTIGASYNGSRRRLE